MTIIISIVSAIVVQVPPAHDQATTAIRQILDQKQTSTDFASEYVIHLPATPSATGGVRTVRFMRSKDRFFAEELRDLFSSRLFVSNKKAFFEYWDEAAGYKRVRLTFDLGTRTPEKFIEEHGFVLNDYKILDHELTSAMSLIRTLSGAQPAKDAEWTAEMRWKNIGTVIVSCTPRSIVAEFPKHLGKPIFEYHFWDRIPESLSRREQEFRHRFEERSNTEIRTLQSEAAFDFGNIMEAVASEGSKNEIPLELLPNVAAKYGYRIPTIGSVLKAEGITVDRPQRSIDISVEFKKRQFDIAEFVPKIDRNALPKNYVRGERRLNGIEIVRVFDLGTKHTLTYYFAPQATYIVNGDCLGDKDLEELIQSFADPK